MVERMAKVYPHIHVHTIEFGDEKHSVTKLIISANISKKYYVGFDIYNLLTESAHSILYSVLYSKSAL